MSEPTPAPDGSAEPARDPAAEQAPEHPAVARPVSGAGPEPAAEPVGAEPAAGEPVGAASVPAAEEAPRRPAGTPVEEAPPAADRTAVLPAEPARDDRTEVLAADRRPAAPDAATRLPAADAPLPPRRASNRLVGTAWVLLGALLFEVLYLVLFAVLVLVVDGVPAVGSSMQQLVATPFAWLPVVLFALFYELTVLLLNRAGRFAYVLSSLVVALIVYVLSAVLILAMQQGGLGNEVNLGRALIVPQVVLIPIVAREVMLWTGLAVGARGHRVRRRNRAAQEQYERERFAREAGGTRDGAGAPV